MSDTNLASAAETHERFATDLALADVKVVAAEVVAEEASVAAGQAQGFLEEAIISNDRAVSERESIRRAAIAAIETTGEAGDTDVLTALMKTQGKTDEYIEGYFSHVKEIDENVQPIVIIGRPETVGVSGLTRVVFGMTPGLSGNAFINRDNRLRLESNDQGPGSRDLVIPILSRRGFITTMKRPFDSFSADVFAKAGEQGETGEPIIVNPGPGHSFEEIRFAGSAEQVEAIMESAKEDKTRSVVDDAALDAVGLPMMVAYGAEAVGDVASRIRSKGSLEYVLARRSIEGLGVDSLPADLSNIDIPASLKESLYADFGRSLDKFMGLRINGKPPTEEELAFLGPLQDAIGYPRAKVLEAVERYVLAFYGEFEDGGRVVTRVVTRESSSPFAIENELRQRLEAVKRVAVQSTADEIPEIARGIKKEAIEAELAATPRRKFLRRQKINADLEKIRDI